MHKKQIYNVFTFSPLNSNSSSLIKILFVLLITMTSVNAEDLLGVYRQALEKDPEFRAQQAALAATLESRPQALAQWRLPTISASANADRNYQDIDNPTGFGTGGDLQYTAYGYSLDLRQPIYHKDRFIQTQKVDATIRQTELELEAAEQSLIIRSAERYFAVLAAEDNLWFSKAEEAALERQLEQAKERLDAGLAAIMDVHEAQAGYDLARANVLQARDQIDDSREALREMIGVTPAVLVGLGDDLPLFSPALDDIDQWTQMAISQNP